MRTRRRLLAGLGLAVLLATGVSILVGVWPIPQEVGGLTIEPATGGGPASVEVALPEWLWLGSAAEVKVGITTTRAGTASDLAQAWVAKLSSADLEVWPSEEQAASLTAAGGSWEVVWRVRARGEEAGATLTLAQRTYDDHAPDDTIVYARFLTFEVRRPPGPFGLRLFGLGAGLFLLFVTRRQGS